MLHFLPACAIGGANRYRISKACASLVLACGIGNVHAATQAEFCDVLRWRDKEAQAIALVQQNPSHVKQLCLDMEQFGEQPNVMPLEWAWNQNQTELIDAIINAGADINRTSLYTRSLLSDALLLRGTKRALMLWQHGARFKNGEERRAREVYKTFFEIYDKAGGDAAKMGRVNAVKMAVMNRDIPGLTEAIAQQPPKEDFYDANGRSLLYVALDHYPLENFVSTFDFRKNGAIGTISLLQSAGLPIDQPHAALPQLLADLLRKDANPAERVVRLLDAGVARHYRASLPLFLEKFRSSDGKQQAAGWKEQDIVREISFPLSQHMVTALDAGQFEIADRLLAAGAKMDVNQSPLLIMANIKNKPGLWAWLFKSGIPFSEWSINESFAYLLMSGTGSPDVVAELIKRGANINQKLKDGRTPIMKLADDGPEPLFSLLLAQQPMLPDFYAEASSAARARDDVKTEFWRNKAKQFKQLDPAKEKALAKLVLSEKNLAAKEQSARKREEEQSHKRAQASATTSTYQSTATSRSGGFQIYDTDRNSSGRARWFATCSEGGSAWVMVERDWPNIFGWGGTGFPGATGGSDVGIGVEAAMRKACIGTN